MKGFLRRQETRHWLASDGGNGWRREADRGRRRKGKGSTDEDRKLRVGKEIRSVMETGEQG